MRTRINHILVCCSNTLEYSHSKEIQERNIRRSRFERRYSKRIKLVGRIDPTLISFSDGVAKALLNFKQNYYQ